jgi:hypothetical protein
VGRNTWLLIALAGMTVLLFVALIFVPRHDDQFLPNCHAAGFDDHQCAFLLAIDQRRAGQEATDAAIHAASGN